MNRIRAVFFDLDGTLYDRDALVCELARDQHRLFGRARTQRVVVDDTVIHRQVAAAVSHHAQSF